MILKSEVFHSPWIKYYTFDRIIALGKAKSIMDQIIKRLHRFLKFKFKSYNLTYNLTYKLYF